MLDYQHALLFSDTVALSLYLDFEKAVPIAVVVQHSSAPQLQAGLSIPLRIEFYRLDTI